jgi:hypothetical protein
MRNVTLLFDKHMHIPTIISFVSTEMLCTSRTLDQDRQNQGSRIPFVVLIGTSDMDRQGCTALIDQNMDLTPHFGAISGVLAGVLLTQRGRDRFAIHRLPGPANVSGTSIISQHSLHDANKHTLRSPLLKAIMDHTTRNTKKVFLDSLPLAASPQHIPDAIHHCVVVGPWSTWAALFYFGKLLLDLLPQFSGYLSIAYIFGFMLDLFMTYLRYLWVLVNTFITGYVFLFNLMEFEDRF